MVVEAFAGTVPVSAGDPSPAARTGRAVAAAPDQPYHWDLLAEGVGHCPTCSSSGLPVVVVAERV